MVVRVVLLLAFMCVTSLIVACADVPGDEERAQPENGTAPSIQPSPTPDTEPVDDQNSSSTLDGHEARLPMLAYVDSRLRIQLVRANGDQTETWADDCSRRQTGKDGKASDLTWSPNGERLACITTAGAVLAGTPDEPPTTVFEDGVCSTAPAWSFDASRIACRQGGILRIHEYSGDDIAEVTGVEDFQWSPRSELLAYETAPRRELRVMSADGDLVASIGRPIRVRHLAWGRSAPQVAIPVEGGVQIVDRRDIREFDVPGTRPPILVGWALDDSVLIILPVDSPSAGVLAMDVSDGSSTTLPLTESTSDFALSTDGALLAYAEYDEQSGHGSVRVLRLQDGTRMEIDGGTVGPRGYTPAPVFRFSSDNSRLCWIARESVPHCSAVSDGAQAEAVVPLVGAGLSETQAIGSLDPGLQYVAVVEGGTLQIREVSGRNVAELGPPVADPIPFAWRPEPEQ